MHEICDLDVNKFDALQKTLQLLESCEYILIRKGSIHHFVNTSIIIANLTSIFGNDFNLDIVNPRKYIKLFKLMTRKNIKLYDDSEMSRYVISNNEVKLFLPKRIQLNTPISNAAVKLDPVGNAITIKDNKKTIRNFIGNAGVKLLVHESQLKGILVDETGVYQFPEFPSDNIDESNCELLISYGFLAVDADEYNVQLGKDSNNAYWLVTTINFETNINLILMENVNKKTIDNILI